MLLSSLLVALFLIPGLLKAQDEFDTLLEFVQNKSQQSYDSIQTVFFKGRSKTYIYFGYSPLEVNLVPLYDEYYFDGYWMKPDSLRLIIRAMRSIDPDSDSTKTTIMDDMPLPNPFHYIYDPSMLGFDKEEEDKIWPLYPFAAGGDSIYDYHLENEIGFGENRIFVVRVEPSDLDMPAVVGTFMIDAHRHEVVGSDVHFTEATSVFVQAGKKEGKVFKLLVTGTDRHRIKTEKALLYSSYWLPLTMEEEFELRLWGMDVKIHRFIDFDSYIVNPGEVDTTFFSGEKIAYRRDPEMEKEVFKALEYRNRLSREEQELIVGQIRDRLVSSEVFKELIDSEALAREATKLTLQQRYGRHLRSAQGVGDYVLYNRIEGLRLHHGFVVSDWLVKNSSFSLSGGYGLSDERWKGEFGFFSYFSRHKKFFFDGSLFHAVGYEENRRTISTLKNTYTSFLLKRDYRDYYYKTGGRLGLGYRVTEKIVLNLSYVSQMEKGAKNNTKFSLFSYKRPFRSNPTVLEGKYHGLTAALMYRSHELNGELQLEWADSGHLGGDFSYRLVKAGLRRRFKITSHSDLHLHGSGGYAWGALPPQRWFDFGGKSFLNYHGNLRGVAYKRFTGDRMARGTLEYAIKGRTFYDIGLKQDWIKALKLTFWVGTGWSELSEKSKHLVRDLDVPMETTDGMYHEFGIGIGDVLNIFRFDFIGNNISGNEILVRFNILQ